MEYLYIYLIVINIIAFALAGIDKRRARTHRWRIRESTLFLTAIAGGSAGLLLGMYIFRHKTKHPQFVFGVPAILILQAAVAVWVIIRNSSALPYPSA